jgi:hypothetical protein
VFRVHAKDHAKLTQGLYDKSSNLRLVTDNHDVPWNSVRGIGKRGTVKKKRAARKTLRIVDNVESARSLTSPDNQSDSPPYDLSSMPRTTTLTNTKRETSDSNEALGVSESDHLLSKGSNVRVGNSFQPTVSIKTFPPQVSRETIETFYMERPGEGEGGRISQEQRLGRRRGTPNPERGHELAQIKNTPAEVRACKEKMHWSPIDGGDKPWTYAMCFNTVSADRPPSSTSIIALAQEPPPPLVTEPDSHSVTLTIIDCHMTTSCNRANPALIPAPIAISTSQDDSVTFSKDAERPDANDHMWLLAQTLLKLPNDQERAPLNGEFLESLSLGIMNAKRESQKTKTQTAIRKLQRQLQPSVLYHVGEFESETIWSLPGNVWVFQDWPLSVQGIRHAVPYFTDRVEQPEAVELDFSLEARPRIALMPYPGACEGKYHEWQKKVRHPRPRKLGI